ncbi:MAG: 50S ribosomal protein L1 [Planctomycetota bacterium]
MPRKSKRYRSDADKASLDPVPLVEAVNRLKAMKKVKFDQSIDLVMHLGIDPKQADQQLRGAISLPHGVGGPPKKVIAFVAPEKVGDVKGVGAIKAGGEDLVKEIEEGFMDFYVAIAEPAMMRVVSKLGKVLGPKGLMPSPKAGTVTADVATAVKEFAAGKVEYRNDDGGNIHVLIGKQSFEPTLLAENAQVFIDHIVGRKPSSSKGQFVKKVAISGTMTPSVAVLV